MIRNKFWMDLRVAALLEFDLEDYVKPMKQRVEGADSV